ncbi:MOP flippase family protein [Brenneria sp. g21c3]|uniref:MOP flippase family protein n=1 Tax=Brenneria sp. g21c3 TaxID=3093893 RepID=UPI002EAC62E1|nr:MOP flippase family protein [Brenneria sp. g21c3]
MGLINNVKWVSFSQTIKIASQLMGMVIFSRYLTPHEIGLMSMTFIIVNLVNIIRDMGSSAAIIQKNNLTESLKCSVFYLNVVIGISIFVLVFFCSGIISDFFNEPDISGTIKLISFAFPINSVTAIHLALLERESKFNKVAVVEMLSSITSLTIAIVCAVSGAGVYSLVIQVLVYSLISSCGFIFYSNWMPKYGVNFNDLKSIFSFSSNLVAFNFINFFSRNSDQIIIGKNFDASILGQYSLAYKIMLFPIQNITVVLTRSLYPILSRMQDNYTDSINIYINSLKTIAIIITPLMFGISVVSNDFVIVVFGPQWEYVSSFIIWLAPIAIMQSMVSTTGSVFMSHGKTNILFNISIYNALLQIGAFIIGGFYSIDTLIKLYLLANVLMFIPNMMLSLRVLKGSFSRFILAIMKPVIASLIMVFIIISFKRSTVLLEFSHVVSLGYCVALGVVSYAILIVLMEWNLIKEKVRAFKK